ITDPTRLEQSLQSLIGCGKPEDTPAAAIHAGGPGQQRTVISTLRELPAAIRQAGLGSPLVVVLGGVVSVRERLAWFEQKPLFGKRVLVTRPRHQAGEMVERLEELGAAVLVLPTVEVRGPADWSAVDGALEQLPSFQWLVFTSVN